MLANLDIKENYFIFPRTQWLILDTNIILRKYWFWYYITKKDLPCLKINSALNIFCLSLKAIFLSWFFFPTCITSYSRYSFLAPFCSFTLLFFYSLSPSAFLKNDSYLSLFLYSTITTTSPTPVLFFRSLLLFLLLFLLSTSLSSFDSTLSSLYLRVSRCFLHPKF